MTDIVNIIDHQRMDYESKVEKCNSDIVHFLIISVIQNFHITKNFLYNGGKGESNGRWQKLYQCKDGMREKSPFTMNKFLFKSHKTFKEFFSIYEWLWKPT